MNILKNFQSMTKNSPYTTNAEKTEIGFEYQYYYFLLKLLSAKSGESVGLEVKDDVHTELSNNHQILCQLKHTVQKQSGGNSITLSELDKDLWKTIYNWVMIIGNITNQPTNSHPLSFIKKTEFHLITNKSESSSNLLIQKLQHFKEQSIDFNNIKTYISDLKTKDKDIQKYINSLLALEHTILKAFLKQISIQLEIDDLISKIRIAIKEKMIPENKLDDVFAKLDSNIRQDNYINIKAGKKIEITFDEFYKKYQTIFITTRRKFSIPPIFKPILPKDLISQNFIQQLLDIKDLEVSDTEQIVEYTTDKLRTTHVIDSWLQSGDIVTDEIVQLNQTVMKKWKIEFKYKCEKCTDDVAIKNAQEILYNLRKEEFTLSAAILETELSHGKLYQLSDDNMIGWHRDWKK